MHPPPSFPPSLRGVVDHLPATVAYWDATQRCRFVNRSYEAWLGLETAAMLGRTKQELLGPLYERYLPYIEGALRGELQEFERVISHPTAPRFGLAQYVPDVVGGEVRGFYAVVTDVTRFKEAERTLLDVERRLEAGERFTALTTLAAGMAHEINNPLTAALAHVDLALEELGVGSPDVGTITADLRTARESSLRVRDIVQRMKLLAQGASARSEIIDVNEALERALEITRSVLQHRARLTKALDMSLHVEGDAGQLAQLFVHLLTNAGQALTEADFEANQIRLSARRAAALVVIEVSDNGCGIPDALQARIFEPFFTTRPIGAGMGLGLSISNAIAKSFGGAVTVTSSVGQGSTFRVELPAKSPPPPRLSAPSPMDAASHAGVRAERRPRVLVIDDEPAVTKTLQRVLERDCDVCVAHHGNAAISRLLDLELPELDLVLCDVMMPWPDGQAVYARVSAQRQEMAERFVFMTGGASTQPLRAFLDSVTVPVLQKPFEVKRLRAMISVWAKQRREVEAG